MKRAAILILVVLGVLALLVMPGCGNVTLRGEALTAAEVSTMDAYQAAQRVQADANVPNWTKAYLDENFKQWRCFVQSARKDTAWGPRLPGEAAAPSGG